MEGTLNRNPSSSRGRLLVFLVFDLRDRDNRIIGITGGVEHESSQPRRGEVRFERMERRNGERNSKSDKNNTEGEEDNVIIKLLKA